MKKINFLIMKKRFFLFIILVLSTFFMNLFLWNETSQLIREVPTILNLKKISSQNIYELNYIPKVDSKGEIQNYSKKEKEELISFLESFKSIIYANKKMYLNNNDNDTKNLSPLTNNLIEEQIMDMDVNISFMNDLVLLNPVEEELNNFNKGIDNLAIKLSLLSMKERYKEEYNYYFGNFIFGLGMSLCLLSFSLFLIYIIISSSLKISIEEIRLLRIMGLSKRKVQRNFEILLLSPIILSAFVFFIFLQFTGIQIIVEDYVYLIVLNLVLCTVSKYIIDRKLKKEEEYD